MNDLLKYIKSRINNSNESEQIKTTENHDIEKKQDNEEMWGWFIDPEEEYIKRQEQIRQERIRQERIHQERIRQERIKNLEIR